MSTNEIQREEQEIFRRLLSEREKSKAEQLNLLTLYTKCSVHCTSAELLLNELLHSYCAELFDIFVLPLPAPDV